MARKLKAIESKALPKGGNSILNNANYSSANTDEWYTTYETIAEELAHYREHKAGTGMHHFIRKIIENLSDLV